MKKLLTIRPREPLKDGEALVGYNSLFEIDGKELSGIKRADVRFRPDEAVTATLEMLVSGIEGAGIEYKTKEKPKKKAVLKLKVDVGYKLSQLAFDALLRDKWENSVNRAYFGLKG